MKKKRTIYYALIICTFCAAQILIAMHHEAWRDESQAWIIAKNSTVPEIIRLCSSEGHPCLWFFFLKLCILLGCSFNHISYISVAIITLAAALLLWKAPFSSFLKVCILLSPIFYYYNSVICRVYAMIVLLVVLLCIYWSKRREKPIVYGIIIALLFQSHIMICGLAVGCLIEILINDKDIRGIRHLIGFIIPVASLIYMIFELRQTEGSETYLRVNIDYLISHIKTIPIEKSISSVSDFFNYSFFLSGIIIVSIFLEEVILIANGVIIYRAEGFRTDAMGILLVSLSGILFYWFVIIFVRFAEHIQMAIIYWVFLLFYVWTTSLTTLNTTCILREERADICEKVGCNNVFLLSVKLVFVVSCILLIPKTTWIDPMSDINGQFSGSLEMAKFIEDVVPNGSAIVIRNNELSTSIVSYLYESKNRYLIWDLDNGCEFSIHKWGKPNRREIYKEDLYQRICSDLYFADNIYYVNGSSEIEDDISNSTSQMELIAKNESYNTWDEYYQLYKVDHSAKEVHLDFGEISDESDKYEFYFDKNNCLPFKDEHTSFINIQGWVIRKGVSYQADDTISLILIDSSSGKCYRMPTSNQNREDVTSYINDGCNYNYSGFEVKCLSNKDLNPLLTSYKIVFLLNTGGNNKVVYSGVIIGPDNPESIY